jgi:hypothetical protein
MLTDTLQAARMALVICASLVGTLTIAACGAVDPSSAGAQRDNASARAIETPQISTIEAAMIETTAGVLPSLSPAITANPQACRYLNHPPVEPPFQTAVGEFTHVPFQPADLTLITNGIETNDPRFSYQWIKAQGAEIPIYAPADGVLVRIRHKTFRPGVFESDDYDLFFMISCDTLIRFNHITSPREDIAGAYQFGDQPSADIDDDGTVIEYDERQIPSTNIRVEAGDIIGYTSGTPQAHDFDFMVSVADQTVCPFSVFDEPARSALLGLLGPKAASPNGPPAPGYQCVGYGAAP